LPDITVIEEATLRALADACNYSLSAHVPVEAVTARFQTHLRGEAKKALERLRRKDYCYKHPTGRSMTWQLTRKGLDMAKDLKGGLS